MRGHRELCLGSMLDSRRLKFGPADGISFSTRRSCAGLWLVCRGTAWLCLAAGSQLSSLCLLPSAAGRHNEWNLSGGTFRLALTPDHRAGSVLPEGWFVLPLIVEKVP